MTKASLNMRIDADLLEHLDEWCNAQSFIPTRTAVIEGLIRAHLAEYGDVTTCVYCDAGVSRGAVDAPDVDDDEAWAEIAKAHHDHCEWIETRAHRVDMSGRGGQPGGPSHK